MSTFQELRQQAKERGINSFGMKKEELEAKLAEPADDRRDRPEGRGESPRSARIPLGGMRQKLAYAKRPGYVRRWFNDDGTRIVDALNAGYEHVTEMSEGREVRVSRPVGRHENGSPMMGFLMEIRQEFYDEDQAAKMAIVDEIDATIKGGQPREGNEPGRYYTPSEGTSVRTET